MSGKSPKNPLGSNSPLSEQQKSKAAATSVSSGGKRKTLKVQKPNTNCGNLKVYANLNPHKSDEIDADDFEEKAHCLLHADVYAISGSADSQLSADVYDVKSFGLPRVSKDSPQQGGGAMTNALQKVLSQTSDITFADTMIRMRALLKEKKYTQIPQLSCSHQVKLCTEKFSVINPRAKPDSKRKAVCVGINYFGEQGELGGCVNDARSWVNFLGTQGFKTNDKEFVRYYTDDKTFSMGEPWAKTIVDAMKWLVQDAKEGDSLFFHFSGHGVQLKNEDGTEHDGFDEALAPAGHELDGYIRDESVFKLLVAPLAGGVRLVCIFDCCHSGSIADLSHVWVASDANIAAAKSGDDGMFANALFDFEEKKKAIQEAASATWDACADAANTIKNWGSTRMKAAEGCCKHYFGCCFC